MSEKTLNNIRIVHKHDTEANWLKATNFIPKQGELIIYDIDDTYNYERFKIGDGQTLVSDLPFGSVQSNWEQQNENTLDYIKNKPFYEISGYTDTLTWDGTAEGYYNFYDENTKITFVHISDAVPTLDDLTSFSITDNNGDVYLPEDDWQFAQNENLISFAGPTPIFIILVDNFEIDGTIFTKKGIYVANIDGTYMTSFAVKDYQFSTVIIKKLDEKFIPNNIARIENIPVIPEQKQTNWNESNINSKSYIKNRTHYLDYANGEKIPLTDEDIIATWGVINGDGYTTLSVIYDGIEYILEMKCCTDYDHNFYLYNIWYVGNAYLYENLNTGGATKLPQDFINYYGTDDVPFIYALSYHTVGSYIEKCVKFADGSDDHTLELYYIIPKAIPLDEKFIPESVKTWDSLKNKPFYTEVLYDVIAEEQTITLTGVSLNLWEGESTGYLQGDFSQLDIAANYKVTFEGETYWATVVQNNDGLKNLKFTSGASIITIDENGYVVIDSQYYNGDYTFKVEKERIVQHTLDEKYIPDIFVRKEDIIEQKQSDWNQNDETAKDYIKNKPFYEISSYTDTLTWDGTTEGYETFYVEQIDSSFVKLSNLVPSLEELNYSSAIDNDGNEITDLEFSNVNGIIISANEPIFIATEDNVEMEGIIFPTKGIYVINLRGTYITSFTIKNYQFPTVVIKKLDEKYIPNTIAKKSDIPVIPEQKQANWDEFDINSKEYIKNRTHYLDYINGERKPLSNKQPSSYYNIWSKYKALLVIYDGEEYLLKIKYASEPNASVYYVGNFDNLHSRLDSVAPLETNEGSDDVPFLVTCHYHSVIGMAYDNIFHLDESTEHTIELYYIIPKVVPLDEKYVPDTVARKSDILMPDTTLTLSETPADAKAVGDALLEKTDILDTAYLHSKTDGIYKNVNEIISNVVLNDYLVKVDEQINESFPNFSHTSVICAFPQTNSLNYDTLCFQIKGKYQDELYTFSLNGIPSMFKSKDLMISGKFAATLKGMVKPSSNWDVETGAYIDSEDTFLVIFDMFHNSIQEDFVLEELIESIKNAEFSFYATNKNFLPLNNTNEYIPTADYNPATKKYVDESINSSPVVLYEEQELTDEQRAQARSNISRWDWKTFSDNYDTYTYAVDKNYIDYNIAQTIVNISGNGSASALEDIVSWLAAFDLFSQSAPTSTENILNAILNYNALVAGGAIKQEQLVWYRPHENSFGTLSEEPKSKIYLTPTSIKNATHYLQVVTDNYIKDVYYNVDNDIITEFSCKYKSVANNFKNSGMAADAKNVGDALALKVDIATPTSFNNVANVMLINNIDILELEMNKTYISPGGDSKYKNIINSFVVKYGENSYKQICNRGFGEIFIIKPISDNVISLIFENDIFEIDMTDSSSAETIIVTSKYNQTYLRINNTNEYIPTADYNPATKKYVDNSVALKANISDVKLKDLVVTITSSYDVVNKEIVYSCNIPFADIVTAFESGINVLFVFDNPYVEIGYGVYHKNIPISSTETESRICLVRDLTETTTGGIRHETWTLRADESITYSYKLLVGKDWVTDELAQKSLVQIITWEVDD